MEYLKSFIITLVTAIIFITAVEIIAPGKAMKKYIQFVLGLILVSILLNPIVYLFTKGEEEIVNKIKLYENNVGDYINTETTEAMKEEREKKFQENLNKNCDQMLKDKFGNQSFKTEIQCSFDFDTMTYAIKSVDVGVKDNKIKLIEKVNIDINKSQETISEQTTVENSEEMIKYLMDILKVPSEKISLYNLEG